MLSAVRIWIFLSTLLVASGWILSASHELNRAGYGIIFALAAAVVFFWRKKIVWPKRKNFSRALHKFPRRFKRPAPLFFLVLAILTFAGGVLHISGDGDSFAYRIPRVVHWLAQERWHWIRTTDYRMNIAGCDFEWMSAPIILFTHSIRFIFLINWISYLMLPGLIFSVFTRLHVRPRVAWWWMWIISSGWCYAMQAGTTHNDSLAVIYALAMVDFALRARESKRVADIWLSLLAAALMTGLKQTNIPLALLWLIAIWPSVQLLSQRPFIGGAVAAVGALVSALPLIFLNLKHGAAWTGIPAGTNLQLNSPFWGIVGNLFCIPAQNLMPPFFPWADRWNAAMQHFLQTPFGAHFASFESFGHLNHSVSDGNAGIGLGICLFVLSSICALHFHRSRGTPKLSMQNFFIRLLHFTPWLLLLIFMAKVGTFNSGRQLSPYYVFFFPIFLTNPSHTILSRQNWWQRFGLLIMLITALLLIFSRSRPLFPAQTLIARLQMEFPDSHLFAKASNSFASRSSYETERNFFEKILPANEKVIGYATFAGGAEAALPISPGRTRIERVLPDDTFEQLYAVGIHYVVVDDNALRLRGETIEQWMSRQHGELVDQLTFLEDPFRPPSHLYFVRLSQPQK